MGMMDTSIGRGSLREILVVMAAWPISLAILSWVFLCAALDVAFDRERSHEPRSIHPSGPKTNTNAPWNDTAVGCGSPKYSGTPAKDETPK